jgi:tetratricopeptide (TPR) repeat protein/ribosomal protein S28E/S33
VDKYEYNLKLDQMKTLFAEEKYEDAADIADTINWNKIKNVSALVKAGEIYEKTERYAESRDVLLMAYDRSPIGRMIIYRLAEVAIKMEDYGAAEAYYNEFVEIAPHDTLRYVLNYDIKKAQGASEKELIPILEEFKEQEYTEEWAYELAYLYHKAGMSEKCIDACDELILWFGDGPYVERALELKMLYQPLTKVQEEKYRSFRQARDVKAGLTHINIEEMARAGEYGHEPVTIPKVNVNMERFNTVNLQEEIAKGMQQIIDATEKETVSDTMDNINKIVEDIPYLKLPKEEVQQQEEYHIETDEEIDGSINMNFQEMLGEESDGQIRMMVDDRAMVERQITGQITIEDVLEEWERTKRAAEAALEDAKQRKLESAKARALQQAGDIMDRLTGVIPKLDAGVTPRELLEEEYMQNELPLDTMPQGYMSDELPAGTKLQGYMPDELPAEPMQEYASAGSMEAEQQEYSENELPTEMQTEDGEQESAEETGTDEVPADETQDEAVASDSVVSGSTAAGSSFLGAAAALTRSLLAGDVPARDLTANGTTAATSAATETSEPSESEPAEEDAPIPKATRPIEELTDEQKAVFSYFMPIKGMEEQIFKALSGISTRLVEKGTAATANLIIQGGQGCGKTTLATSIIKVLQNETGYLTGKVGKIKAELLNKKDLGDVLRRVEGGCLIIEQAGALSRQMQVSMSLRLDREDSGLLIILEDTSKGIRKLLLQDDRFARMFSERITVPIFTNDELVGFAHSYAKELGYKIDEMAVLALYNRISKIERLDQATTLTEIKEIVDEAIRREASGGIKKAFSILTASRYTDDDRIVLREKDFE